MKHAHWHGVSIVAAMAFFVCFAHAAEPPREAHGSADAYGEPGVALAYACKIEAGTRYSITPPTA